MSLVKTLMLGAALAGAVAGPALAGGDGGWGGRYASHYDQSRASSYQYSGSERTSDGGYHSFGGGVSRTEESGDTGWVYRRLDTGEVIDGPPRGADLCGASGERHWESEAWVNGRRVAHHEGGAHDRTPPHRRCGVAEVSLPMSFFGDAGGVGGFPESDFGGGGGGFAFADAGASAHASASASASARVSVSIRGGVGHGHRRRRRPHEGARCGCGGKHYNLLEYASRPGVYKPDVRDRRKRR